MFQWTLACALLWFGCGKVSGGGIDASGSNLDSGGEGCVVDCAGVCGGTAALDHCGACDSNPANDCLWPDNRTAYCITGSASIACPGGTAGQDGQYLLDVPAYVVTTDTVADPVTTLVWQRNPPYTDVDYPAAVTACDNLTLAGFDDWRLPTRLDMASLLDAGRVGPPFDPAAFPAIPGNSFFWTSTADPANNAQNFGVNTNYPVWGFQTNTTSASTMFYRCVRGTMRTGTLTLSQNRVVDSRTNLSWQSGVGPASVWADALAYCEGLTLDALSDWRLPSWKELSSIVDDTRSSPAISVMFGTRPTGFFWSSTPLANFGDRSYALDFTTGSSGGTIDTLNTVMEQVRCVRGPG